MRVKVELWTSLEVGCEEYYLYNSRFFTFDEAEDMFYALLRTGRKNE